MTDPELQAIVRGLVPAVRDLVAAALTPVVARLASLEAAPPARDGRDGLPGPPGPAGRDGVDGAAGVDGAPGANGADGFDLADLTASYDGARSLTLTFASAGRSLAVPLTLPVPVYCGVWQKGARYTRGDLVTFGGSVWHANTDPAPDTKPGDGSSTWTLAVKRGQDGRDAKGGA
jgi:hypothetical protein